MLGRLKPVVFLSLAALYVSGVLTWAYQHWFFVRTSFGSEPSPAKILWLDSHSVLGIWFLILFGYLIHAHLQPSWRRRKKRPSGSVLTVVCGVLILTVPGLFYLTNESWRANVSALHTYLGLASALSFLLHYFGKTETPS